jgi:site-specific DNA-cytosine methylase
MKIAVLFDGAGFARRGLELAGHVCHGIELNPVAHYLARSITFGPSALCDARSDKARKIIEWADAVWASPPCQKRSSARTQGEATGVYADDLLDWSLKYLWVENVKTQGSLNNGWGKLFNAAQWEDARHNRQRVIGGYYPQPNTDYEYRPYYKDKDIPPCITASEYKGCATDTRRASRYYGRRLTIQEAAYRMGLDIFPGDWLNIPDWFTGSRSAWDKELYTAIGNGVPVWMAKAFGDAAMTLQKVGAE